MQKSQNRFLENKRLYRIKRSLDKKSKCENKSIDLAMKFNHANKNSKVQAKSIQLLDDSIMNINNASQTKDEISYVNFPENHKLIQNPVKNNYQTIIYKREDVSKLFKKHNTTNTYSSVPTTPPKSCNKDIP